MTLILENRLRIGIQTIHRRTEPANEPWLPRIDELVDLVKLVDDSGYDSLWVGDHISFPVAILDPLLQLAQAAVVSRRLTLGTSVLLLPLRHPTPVAKQITTLDHLTEGRFILGVGVGGEFPKEYAACDVPHNERGARLAEGVIVLRKFFSGQPVTHHGKFYGPFEGIPMNPPPRQPNGPPIWFAGRKEPALRRIGRLGDGYLAYVITPDMYRSALVTISQAAEQADRGPIPFGTGHLLFTRLGSDIRSGARSSDGNAERSVRNGFPQGCAAILRVGDAPNGGRSYQGISCRRCAARRSGHAGTLRTESRTDRLVREGGDAAAGGPNPRFQARRNALVFRTRGWSS